MKNGDTVNYRGKGFLNFDKKITSMKVLKVESNDVWVEYKGTKMMVRKHEIAK